MVLAVLAAMLTQSGWCLPELASDERRIIMYVNVAQAIDVQTPKSRQK
jgi:hypothetical protein